MHYGRDLFVRGPSSAEEVGALFAEAFSLKPAQVLMAGDPEARVFAAYDHGAWIVVSCLDGRGHFPFKVDLEFQEDVGDAQYRHLASNYDIEVAVPIEDTEPHNDFAYAIYSGRGMDRRELDFVETGEAYMCNLLGNSTRTEPS